MKTKHFKSICISLISLALLFCSCTVKQNEGIFGVHAVISEIDYDTKVLTVSGIEQSLDIFGENCLVDCDNLSVVYCNFETEKTTFLDFSDFQIGDEVLLSFSSDEEQNAKEGKAKADSVQLYTQRLNS